MTQLRFTLITLILILCTSLRAEEINFAVENERLLSILDETIAHKSEYQRHRKHQADSLRAAARLKEGAERIQGLRDAYELYNRFLLDSVFVVLDEIRHCPEYSDDASLQAWTGLSEARNYGVMGIYKTAFDLIEKYDPETLPAELQLHYYNTISSVIGWDADFTSSSAKALSDSLRKQEITVQNKIYELEKDEFSRVLIRCNIMIESGAFQQCIDTLMLRSQSCHPSVLVYVNALLAQAYIGLGDDDAAIYYLAKTSYYDIANGVTEYITLPILAEMMQKQGQSERAYRYLTCSLEDANICHSSLRSVEATTVFPIIEEARRINDELRDQKEMMHLYIGISVAVFLLGLMFFYFWDRKRFYEVEMKRRKQHLDEVTYIAEHDELTHLLNRHGGKHLIIESLQNHTPGYLCVLDVDLFKRVNDTYGHEVGDKVLQSIGKCLMEMDEQIVIRMGGDEFCSYCQLPLTAEQYRAMVEEFFTRVRSLRFPEMGDKSISVSLGVVYYDGQSDISFDDLFAEADRRLYVSKQTQGCALTM